MLCAGPDLLWRSRERQGRQTLPPPLGPLLPSTLPRSRQRPWPSDAPTAPAPAGMFKCRLARRRLVSAFDSSPCRPGATLVEGLDLSQQRSIARLAPDSRTDLVSRPTTRPTSSHARCSRTGRWRPVLAGLLGLGAGGYPGV